jgi:hypothetical protein
MRTPLPVAATVAWSTLGIKWVEMLAASGQVFARRVTRTHTPAQLFGICSEKVEAAIESSNAMTRQMIGFPTGNALAAWNAWAGVLMSGLAPYHARTARNARAGRRR